MKTQNTKKESKWSLLENGFEDDVSACSKSFSVTVTLLGKLDCTAGLEGNPSCVLLLCFELALLILPLSAVLVLNGPVLNFESSLQPLQRLVGFGGFSFFLRQEKTKVWWVQKHKLGDRWSWLGGTLWLSVLQSFLFTLLLGLQGRGQAL